MKRRINNKLSKLDSIQVTRPCDSDWELMSGDDRIRFCEACQKNVYNLSSMTRSQAEDLVQNARDRLCIRFERLRDGTILTRPEFAVFDDNIRFRHPAFSRAAITAVLSFNLAVPAFPLSIHQPSYSASWSQNRPNRDGATDQGAASIVGGLFDANQAVIVGATVTLVKSDGGFIQTSRSSDEGTFQFESLQPGIYTLRVEARGFLPVSYANFTLTANRRLVQDISLVVDSATESVTGALVDLPVVLEAERIPDTLLRPLNKPENSKRRRSLRRPKSERTRR